MYIEIRKSDSKNPLNRYYYVTVGSNGEVMNTSETFFSKSNCKRAARDMAELIHCHVNDTTEKPYKTFGASK